MADASNLKMDKYQSVHLFFLYILACIKLLFNKKVHVTYFSVTGFERTGCNLFRKKILKCFCLLIADHSVCFWLAVMRTQGSLRVILNTKLWPHMQVDKVSEKSLRITAMDTEEQGVKVFLISVRMHRMIMSSQLIWVSQCCVAALIWSHLISQSSSKDTAQLFAALHHRILALRSISGQESGDQPAIRFSDDDEPRTPPTAATPAPGNISYWYQIYGCGIKCMVVKKKKNLIKIFLLTWYYQELFYSSHS